MEEDLSSYPLLRPDQISSLSTMTLLRSQTDIMPLVLGVAGEELVAYAQRQMQIVNDELKRRDDNALAEKEKERLDVINHHEATLMQHPTNTITTSSSSSLSSSSILEDKAVADKLNTQSNVETQEKHHSREPESDDIDADAELAEILQWAYPGYTRKTQRSVVSVDNEEVEVEENDVNVSSSSLMSTRHNKITRGGKETSQYDSLNHSYLSSSSSISHHHLSQSKRGGGGAMRGGGGRNKAPRLAIALAWKAEDGTSSSSVNDSFVSQPETRILRDFVVSSTKRKETTFLSTTNTTGGDQSSGNAVTKKKKTLITSKQKDYKQEQDLNGDNDNDDDNDEEDDDNKDNAPTRLPLPPPPQKSKKKGIKKEKRSQVKGNVDDSSSSQQQQEQHQQQQPRKPGVPLRPPKQHIHQLSSSSSSSNITISQPPIIQDHEFTTQLTINSSSSSTFSSSVPLPAAADQLPLTDTINDEPSLLSSSSTASASFEQSESVITRSPKEPLQEPYSVISSPPLPLSSSSLSSSTSSPSPPSSSPPPSSSSFSPSSPPPSSSLSPPPQTSSSLTSLEENNNEMRKEVTPLESQPLQSQQYTPSRKIVESFNDLHAPPCDEENSVRIITKLTPSRSTSDSIASAIKENDVTTSVNSAAEKGPSASIESETPRRTVMTQSPIRISSSSEKNGLRNPFVTKETFAEVPVLASSHNQDNDEEEEEEEDEDGENEEEEEEEEDEDEDEEYEEKVFKNDNEEEEWGHEQESAMLLSAIRIAPSTSMSSSSSSSSSSSLSTSSSFSANNPKDNNQVAPPPIMPIKMRKVRDYSDQFPDFRSIFTGCLSSSTAIGTLGGFSSSRNGNNSNASSATMGGSSLSSRSSTDMAISPEVASMHVTKILTDWLTVCAGGANSKAAEERLFATGPSYKSDISSSSSHDDDQQQQATSYSTSSAATTSAPNRRPSTSGSVGSTGSLGGSGKGASSHYQYTSFSNSTDGDSSISTIQIPPQRWRSRSNKNNVLSHLKKGHDDSSSCTSTLKVKGEEEEEEDNDLVRFASVTQDRPEVHTLVSKALRALPAFSEVPLSVGTAPVWSLMWTWGKPPVQRNLLLVWQKVNHFRNASELTRKDLLKKNLSRYTVLGGRMAAAFSLQPTTFVLPSQFLAFCEAFGKASTVGNLTKGVAIDNMTKLISDLDLKAGVAPAAPVPNYWIMKPVGLSRGRGIRVISGIDQVRYSEDMVIQKYVHNPMLLEGHKFDLRIYVLVTSFSPLEAFIYKRGYARLSSRPYNLIAGELTDRFIHLTNAAVNRQNQSASVLECLRDASSEEAGGTKCSLEYLWRKLEESNIDTEAVWKGICDVVVKSLVCADDVIPNQPNSFELFGYDIMIDEDLKPWLIEVNSSPSMETDCAFDVQTKTELIYDTIKLVDPIAFDAEALVNVLRRRGDMSALLSKRGPSSGVTPAAAFGSGSRMSAADRNQLNEDLDAILNGRSVRPLGEMPDHLGNYQRICPGSEAFIKAMKLKISAFKR